MVGLMTLDIFSLQVSGNGILEALILLCAPLCGAIDAGLGVVLAALGQGGLFRIEPVACNPDICPGSAYNLITAAWANIAYMTHSDILHLLTETKIAAWAPLLYMVGAIGALIGVAINTPPKTYIWFFLGPAIYWFLVDTTKPVTGVAWTIAGVPQNMSEVWKDAETGLANTGLVTRRRAITVTKEGPSGQYPVAYPMLFLDRLFSATTNILIGWVGIGNQEGTGAANTNLARKEGDGPWYLLADLKWGMLENIVGVQVRDPDVRDALVTFLTSECGDQFKKGVNTGAYIAASQARAASVPNTVFKGIPLTDYDGGAASSKDYSVFVRGLDTEVVPTPRSMIRLFGADRNQRGSFRQFSQKFNGEQADESGRTVEIVCSEYLYMIIQALRWESGHAFWQLLRSSPDGFNRTTILKSLFYGFDIRERVGGDWASSEQLEDFVKQLIFFHMLRNELMYAPQVTEVGQRYAPSDQARSFSEAYVRTQGARSKAAELYNWAVLMPHVQGVLLYLVLIMYPFAAMLMVIPGYWKAFFTWITFFAWIKIWDVGFAIVHTLERSVWAMIGNHSSMARVSNALLQVNNRTGRVRVGELTQDCAVARMGRSELSQVCAVPDVTEKDDLSMSQAWDLMDTALTLTGSGDLDLSTGYYIYIMAALYFAVPAVTGQLVLGAKAGLGGLATQAIGQNAQEAGTATKQAAVGDAVNKLATNQSSLGQAAMAKSHRKSGLGLAQLENSQAAMEQDIAQSRMSGIQKGLDGITGARKLSADSFGAASMVQSKNAFINNLPTSKPPTESGTGAGTGAGTGGFGSWAGQAGNNMMSQWHNIAAASSGARSLDIGWANQRAGLAKGGFQAHANTLAAEADYTAKEDAWKARNDFATHMAGMGGVSGMNPGSIAPGAKPDDVRGLALSGNLGASAEGAARYSGSPFFSQMSRMTSRGAQTYGSNLYAGNWSAWTPFETTAANTKLAADAALGALNFPSEIVKSAQTGTAKEDPIHDQVKQVFDRRGE